MLVKGIILEVYKGTVEPQQIADLYRDVLRLFSLRSASTEAVLALRLTATALQMVVRPAEEDTDLYPGVGSTRHPNIWPTAEGVLKKRQPALPTPAWVAATYSGLKARRLIPLKREGGSQPKAEKLIPAIVASYVGRGRSETLDKREKGRITELVNGCLLESRQLTGEPKQRLNLWPTAETALPLIRDTEERLVRPATRLHKYF